MEAQRTSSQQAESFLDYTQGPSNIDVRPVYETTYTGASKGVLSSRTNLNTVNTEVLGGLEGEVAGSHLNPIHETLAEQYTEQAVEQNVGNDAHEVVRGHEHVHGSSNFANNENVATSQRINYGIETGVDPTVLNNEVIAFNQQASSNLVNKQHELLQSTEQGLRQEFNTNIEQAHGEYKAPETHNLESNVHGVESTFNRNENTEQKITNEQIANDTNAGANHGHGGEVPTANANNDQEEVVGAKEVEPFDTKAGLVTKGTIVFKPLEFRFSGEKNDKIAKVKPLFKAKVGGHNKTSGAGKSESNGFTWTDSITVNYSNQDDATLEIKKAGMFGKTIAAGKIGLAEIIAHRKLHEQTVPLLDKEKVVGELRVEIAFKPKAK